MSKKHPISFFSELCDENLGSIAVRLLDIRYETLRGLNSRYDDNYVRESAVFGRSRNMLIEMAHDSKYPWMSLGHAGMDVTFYIGRVPCRFFRDDPDSPEKPGFFKRNAVDDLFGFDENIPVMWRFVIEKAMTDEDEDQVHFFGYNVFQEKISVWTYSGAAAVLHAVDQDVPKAADIPQADVDVREDLAEDQDTDRKAGNNE